MQHGAYTFHEAKPFIRDKHELLKHDTAIRIFGLLRGVEPSKMIIQT